MPRGPGGRALEPCSRGTEPVKRVADPHGRRQGLCPHPVSAPSALCNTMARGGLSLGVQGPAR